MALKINPTDVKAICNIGNLFLLQKKYTEAKKYYQKALEIDPTDSVARHNLENILKVL